MKSANTCLMLVFSSLLYALCRWCLAFKNQKSNWNSSSRQKLVPQSEFTYHFSWIFLILLFACLTELIIPRIKTQMMWLRWLFLLWKLALLIYLMISIFIIFDKWYEWRCAHGKRFLSWCAAMTMFVLCVYQYNSMRNNDVYVCIWLKYPKALFTTDRVDNWLLCMYASWQCNSRNTVELAVSVSKIVRSFVG